MQYSSEDLKKVQDIELDILREVIRVCNENHIQYFLYAGSLLGAVRHNGFIPWDDDIDIGMLRPDYEKFLSIAPMRLRNGFSLQHFSTDKRTPTYFAKVRKDGTKFVEECSKKTKIHQGIFIDIFPFDFITDNEHERMLLRRKFNFWLELFTSKAICSTFTQKKSKRIFGIFSRTILHLVLIPVPRSILFNRLNKYLTLYSGKNICNSQIIASRLRVRTENAYTDIFPLTSHKFEDLSVLVPNNSDKMLTKLYGSQYMDLPPVEKRVNHAPCILEF